MMCKLGLFISCSALVVTGRRVQPQGQFNESASSHELGPAAGWQAAVPSARQREAASSSTGSAVSRSAPVEARIIVPTPVPTPPPTIPKPQWQTYSIVAEDACDGIKNVKITPPPETHEMPGQYIQVRVPGAEKTDYYPIASAPGADTMEVLLPSDLASHAELEISQVMPPASRNFGPGFRLFQLLSWKMEVIERVILFAEGDGIGAIRSVVESDLLSKSDVELFYGGEEGKMPYLTKVEEWKKRFPVNILPNTDLLKAATESGAAEKKGSRGATIAVGDHTTMFKFSKEAELRALCKEVQIDETRISIFRL